MESLRPIKRSMWDEVDDEHTDQNETSGDGSFVLPYRELSMTQKANLRQAKKFCEALTSQWRETSGMSKQHEILQNQQQAQIQQLMQAQSLAARQKAFAVMCRIYVGSISFEMHESQVKDAFTPFGPIKSLDMSWDNVSMKHKGFCFIEYYVPEAAQLALDQMNGVVLGGRNIKVGRPSSVPAAGPIVAQLQEEAQQYNRIYITGVSQLVKERDLRSALERFGPLRTVQLTADSQQSHVGFGYAEFASAQSCTAAVTQLNATEMGGSYIRICKAVTPPMPVLLPSTAVQAGATSMAGRGAPVQMSANVGNILSKLQAANAMVVNQAQEHTIHREEAIHISGGSARLLLMQKLQRKDESNVVVLRNMVTAADVDSELPREIKEECARFGTVQQVIIHEQQEGMQPVIKIFVQFALAHEAQRAVKGLDGRFFAGKTVKAEIYDREKFDKNDLTG